MINSTPRPLKVFLCHASADKPAVRKLCRYLRSKGMDPWLDAEKLLPGENWEVEIPKALFHSDVILVCLSKNSINKEGYVQKEIVFALDKAMEKPDGIIFIVPAKLEECDVPQRLNRYQWVDLYRDDGRKRLMLSLNKRAAQLGPAVEQAIVADDTLEREKLELEAKEKLARENVEREKAKRDADEKAAREKKEREELEQAERETRTRLAHEKAEREAVEKVAKEKKEREAQEKAILEREEYKAIAKAERESEKIIKLAKRRLLYSKIRNRLSLFFMYLRLYSLPGILLASALLVYLVYKPQIDASLMSIPTTIPATLTSIPFSTQTSFPPTPTSRSVRTSTPSTPTLGIGSTITGEDGMTLLYVPASEFTMGSDNGNEDEKPAHTVFLDAFWIDRTEVTNKQYASCVNRGACSQPLDTKSPMRSSYYGDVQFQNYPVVYVDWYMAKAYCEWTGRRLPMEAEWEKAARGIDGRIYPWGSTPPNDTLLNYNSPNRDTTQVGKYPDGQSPYGAYDIAGNVWEWVSSLHLPYPYDEADGREDLSVYNDRVLRGGAWYHFDGSVRPLFYAPYDQPDVLVRADFRNWFAPKYENISEYGRPPFGFGTVGFRCAMSATP